MLQKPDTNNIDTVDETTIANGIEENGQISRTPKEITSAQDHHTGLKVIDIYMFQFDGGI